MRWGFLVGFPEAIACNSEQARSGSGAWRIPVCASVSRQSAHLEGVMEVRKHPLRPALHVMGCTPLCGV